MKNKIKGIRIISVFLPAAILIFVLYVFIVVSTVLINTTSTKSINLLNTTSDCLRDVSELQARNSKLFQTSTSFIQKPVIEQGPNTVINITPLSEYVSEIYESIDPEDIRSDLREHNISSETFALVEESIEAMKELNVVQSHAIYLIAASFEEDPQFNTNLEQFNSLLESIQKYELTEQEKALPYQAKRNIAASFIAAEYNQKNGALTEKLDKASKNITAEATARQTSLNNEIKMLRGLLWGLLLLILIANFFCLFIIVFMLVVPIVRFTKTIDNNGRLNEDNGLYEAKRLAVAYNALLDRHKEFENELREVAEEDALTGLPNRYSYNAFLNNPVLDDRSVCIFVFDINNLKYVNDNFGHDKGDELIKNASECIKTCFLTSEKMHCYRIGGDEFVAILEGIYIGDIENLLQGFKTQQSVRNVSIAVGYSYIEHINEIGYEKLIIEADKRMYENKNEMKNN